MNLRRPIDAHADEEVVLLEERAPFIIEECGVRLKRILDCHAGAAILLLIGDSTAEEVYTHQRRFAALPCEGDFVHLLCLNVLLDIVLQNLVIHPK